MIHYMKRKLNENQQSNMVLAACILTLIGGVAAISFYLLDAISNWTAIGL